MKPSARPSAGQTALRFSKLKEKGTTVEPPTKKVRKIRCTTRLKTNGAMSAIEKIGPAARMTWAVLGHPLAGQSQAPIVFRTTSPSASLR